MKDLRRRPSHQSIDSGFVLTVQTPTSAALPLYTDRYCTRASIEYQISRCSGFIKFPFQGWAKPGGHCCSATRLPANPARAPICSRPTPYAKPLTPYRFAPSPSSQFSHLDLLLDFCSTPRGPDSSKHALLQIKPSPIRCLRSARPLAASRSF